MSPRASDAAVPRVDRALGALLTFPTATALATVAASTIASSPAGLTDIGALLAGTTTEALLAGTLAGALLTAWLVLAGGFDLLLVPVEGRRWTVELAIAGVAFLATNRLADAVPELTVVWVALFVAAAAYGTVYAGETVADAFDWYDRDAYPWHDDSDNRNSSGTVSSDP